MLGLLKPFVSSLAQQLQRSLGRLAILELPDGEQVQRLGVPLLERPLIPALRCRLIEGVVVLAELVLPGQVMLRLTVAAFGCTLKPMVSTLNA